jgi:hypothetical protein
LVVEERLDATDRRRRGMTGSDPTRAIVEAWIAKDLHLLTPLNPVHIHSTDLLEGQEGTGQQLLKAIRLPFLHTIDVLGERLVDVMPVLVIPLESTATLVCEPPPLESLDLSAEPPSIYLLHRDSAKTFRPGEQYRRFLRNFTLFDRDSEDVFFFFEAFRSERESGAAWEFVRSILGEHYLPMHRTGWQSAHDAR